MNTKLFRFYNINESDYGTPFALCDQHKEAQRVPVSCILEEIAEKSKMNCVKCEDNEPTTRKDEG